MLQLAPPGGGAEIGNNVLFGCNAVIIGPIKIGDNVKIGAGAIIVEDIPANSTAVSNKARVIRKEDINT